MDIVIADLTHLNMVQHVSSMMAHAYIVSIEENTWSYKKCASRDGFIPLAKVIYGCVHFCYNSFLTSFVQATITYHQGSSLVPILYINSLGLPVCDVTFCCIIIFYVSAAEPAIGKSIFVWNWHPGETRLIFTRPSVRDRAFRPVNGLCDANSATPKNEPQRPILLRICFFFYLFFGFVFSDFSPLLLN